MAVFEVFSAAVYDHATSRIEVMAWLHQENELFTLSKSATWNLFQEGNEVAIASATQATANKRMHAVLSNVVISPDKLYFLETTVVDNNDVPHKIGSALATLD